jgi:hypothetical protein
VVVLAATALFVLSAAVLALRLGPVVAGTLSAPTYPIPSEQTITLTAGPWVVFEQTGSQGQAGPVSVSTNRAPRLRPDDVRVADAQGRSLILSRLTSTQTVTQGPVTYTGAVAFTVPADGAYRVAVSGTGGGFLLAPDVFSVFRGSVLWFALVGVSVVGLALGVVLLLVGRRRLPQNVRPAPRLVTTPVAPPGWYADPRGSGGYLWWDGYRWRTPPPPPGQATR